MSRIETGDAGIATPYLPHRRPLVESREQLRARIPGWGVDLDPADRPSVPREHLDRQLAGFDAELPDRQPEKWPRERSIEHPMLTPVFGTSCPPRGVSGALRKLAYARYSEARAAHWLLLLLADRVESRGAVARSFLTTRPDNPITETGVLSEFSHGGIRSRVGHKRADVGHHALDPVLVGGPWLLSAWLGYRLARRALR